MEAAGVQLYKNDEIWTKDGYRPDESLQWASRYGIPMEPVYPRIRQQVYEGVSPERPVIGRGTRVHNATETIGYIDHLLVDSDSGWITHLVVRRGLVPFRAIIPMELVKSISDESYVENVWRTYMEREFSVLNTAARLSSQARVGEILISNEAWAAAQLPDSNLEERELALNGKEETVLVKVLADYSLPV